MPSVVASVTIDTSNGAVQSVTNVSIVADVKSLNIPPQYTDLRFPQPVCEDAEILEKCSLEIFS